MTVLAAAVASFVVSLIGCEFVRQVALRRKLLDAVNDRSLHKVPTPRLGGVAIVATTATAALLSWPTMPRDLAVLLGACAAIALVGLRDDIKPLGAAPRLLVQAAVGYGFVRLVGGAPFVIARGYALPLPEALTTALLVFWIVGVLNIYNFMDGMDGLAGSQAVTAALSLGALFVGEAGLQAFALALAAAALGFLAHNFPPARIFMGDAGSTFIGMAFAALAVVGLKRGIPITETALPLAPFLLDGTFTILRRASRKEKVWQAHRTHLYQRAAQSGVEHRVVLLVYLAWMAVCAAAATLASTGATALGLGWAVAILGLVLVWRWVVGRESERPALA